MGKHEIVRQTKRANSRLKPVGDVCYGVALGQPQRPLARERALMLERLDRELHENDVGGADLRAAVASFWQAVDAGVEAERLVAQAEAVYIALRRVQSDRWRRVEQRHGRIGHYFDRFGQVRALQKRHGGADEAAVGLLARLVHLVRLLRRLLRLG